MLKSPYVFYILSCYLLTFLFLGLNLLFALKRKAEVLKSIEWRIKSKELNK